MEKIFKKILKIGLFVSLALIGLIIVFAVEDHFYWGYRSTKEFDSEDGNYKIRVTKVGRTYPPPFLPNEVIVSATREGGKREWYFNTHIRDFSSATIDVSWTDEGATLTIGGEKEQKRSYLLLWEYVFEEEDEFLF